MTHSSISGYSLAETLSEGAHSIVYRGTRDASGRPVVVKVLNAEYPTLEQIARLRREYRMTREAHAEGVIEALGLERYGASLAIILEDFGGQSLSTMAQAAPIELRQLLGIGARLAGALGRVHQRRIIHKDVTLSNIVYNPRADVVKLIDFGIASELSREAPANVGPGRLEGTLPYISPEQTGRMNRAIDYRTDLYSLGVTLYQLATGRLPFTSIDPLELVHCHIAQAPVPPHDLAPAIPPVVSEIICRLMAKRAEDRYQSAFKLQADLMECAGRLDKGRVTAFSIGEGDVSDRFQLPQKLYGREGEIQELIAAFDRIASGGKEMMLIAGYSGIGKSALVHEVHKPIVKRRGHFISGKFDQRNRSVPYASLIQSVEELVRQLLTESADDLVRWRGRILDAVGPNARLIIDVIQEVELVVGPQPPVAELPPKEAQNRFNIVFESFFRVFAGPSHPLTIFLDDLQWADLPSLKLIERLMTDVETTHMLLVGAYRDNEVTPGHPLLVTVDHMRRHDAAVRTITLTPLGREHVIELLVDTLACDGAEAAPLADACLAKTGGNPFFLGQFLLSLHERGGFRFDEGAAGWRWDLAHIARMDLTDNVVDLMAGKIRGLPAESQRALRLAACIGNTFDLKTLAVFLDLPPVSAAAALWPCLSEGLVLPIDDAYMFVEDKLAGREGTSSAGEAPAADAERVIYRFLHDRVQQAAYSLIPPESLSELHLRVGRLLIRSAGSDQERDDRVFTITGHMNIGSALITSREERDELAALNLVAGGKAKASAAYSAACEHFRRGIELLGEGGFERRRELAIELHLQAAEASYLDKDFGGIDRYAGAVLDRAGDMMVRVKIAEIRIQAFNAQNKIVEAVQTALQILKLLGIEFPDRPAPDDLLAGVRDVDAAIGGRRIESLIDLPPMTDPAKVATIRILATTIPTSYLCDPALFPLIALRQVELSITWGNAGPSASGYAAWAIILCGALDRIDDGYAFGKLAVSVLGRYNARNHEARTEYIVSCFITHWKDHVREAARTFKDIYRTALETGDLDFAGYALVTQATQLYFSGADLSDLNALLASSVQALLSLRLEPHVGYTQIQRQLVHNLLGHGPDPTLLTGEVCDEGVITALHTAANDVYGLSMLHLWKAQSCLLFGRHAEAVEHADWVRANIGGLVGNAAVPVSYMIDALARLAALPSAPEERERALARVDEDLARLTFWAEHAPMNHAHRRWLVEAERRRVVGEPERARQAYHRAMALAREHEYRNDEALAMELFARFAVEQGEHDVAKLFLLKAWHLYGLWGAAAKVRDLEREHPTILPPSRTITDTSGDNLDLLSVLKASQAISGEVVLPELLKKLMSIVLENAGATRGILFLEGDSPLVIEDVRGASRDAAVLRGASIIERDDVPQSIVRYVRRVREPVLLGDGQSVNLFQSDPYIAGRRPRSLLCQPIVRQNELVGILYLENDLVANAFTPDRCRVLELLCAQAAISLENAQLYNTLDNRVKERTRELTEALDHLQQTQQRLVLHEKLASLGMLTSGIAHEIRNPLNFVNNFAEMSVGLADELAGELSQAGGRLDADGVSSVLEVAAYLKENVAKILEHGKRAEDIVRSMLMHSRSSGRAREESEVNRLVASYTSLAYQAFRLEAPAFEASIDLRLDPAAPRAAIDPQEIARVVQNLVNNACYAMLQRGQGSGAGFEAELVVSTLDAGDRIEIRIHDNGGGIPEEVREHVFTPFFTTKPTGEGTGLGLSISHDIIVQGHGGTLDFIVVDGESTEFVITLPRRSGGLQRAEA